MGISIRRVPFHDLNMIHSQVLLVERHAWSDTVHPASPQSTSTTWPPTTPLPARRYRILLLTNFAPPDHGYSYPASIHTPIALFSRTAPPAWSVSRCDSRLPSAIVLLTLGADFVRASTMEWVELGPIVAREKGSRRATGMVVLF